MSLIASRSACLGSRVAVSGAFTSVNLQLDLPVLGADREGLDRREGGGGFGAAASQVEKRAVSWALDRTGRLVELALGERAVVVRAAVLDGEKLAAAVEDTDLDAVDGDDLPGPLWELFDCANGVVCHLIPTLKVGF